MRATRLIGRDGPTRILCLGAHSDDIEIGAGGSILHWLGTGAALDVRWCIASASGDRADEATRSAKAFLDGAADIEIVLGGFRDGYLPAQYGEVKDWVEAMKSGPAPDIVLTHRRDDAHQDHRVLSELAWSSFRDHMILEYEVPKWDGDLGQPNSYVGFDESVMERKISLLHDHFASQRGKPWFDAETFRGLARLRGVECRQPYAEAFWSRKMLIG